MPPWCGCNSADGSPRHGARPITIAGPNSTRSRPGGVSSSRRIRLTGGGWRTSWGACCRCRRRARIMIDRVRELFARIRSLFRGSNLDRDFKEELDAHLEIAIAENKRRGLTDEEARRQALLRLGGAEQAREQHRDARGLPGLETLMQDTRYALRTLRRDAGFTTIAILILALGIGANTAVFSVVDTVLLRPLPFPEAHQLVRITQDDESGGLSGITYQVKVLEEFRRENRSFQSLTAYFPFFGDGDYKMTGTGEPERLSGVMVAQDFFQTLGVQPSLGRLFTNEECRQHGRNAVLLSHAFWVTRFASDPGILGRNLTLNNAPVTVVGVLPATFDFGSVFAPGTRVDIFTPAIFDDMRTWGNVFMIVGRLKPGVTVQRASAEFSVLVPAIQKAHPDWWGVSAKLTGLKDSVTGKLHRSLVVLWGAVGLVLLIVCVNLSNLLVARTAARQKEFAIRRALGAGMGRLVRQLFTESLLLSSAGAILGLVFAYAITGTIARNGSLAIPLLSGIRIDGTALGFTVLIAVLTALLFGVAPGIKMGAANLQDGLKDASRGFSGSRKHAYLRGSLVVCEVTLTCVLLTCAGLLLRSFLRLMDV